MNHTMFDYRFGWRWLLPCIRDKTVSCAGLSNDEQAWWVLAAKVDLGDACNKRIDGYLISLDGIATNSINNLINTGDANWVCAWGSGRAVDQLRKQLVGFSIVREYALLPVNNPRVVIPLSSTGAAIAGLSLHRPGRLIARIALSVARVLATWGSYSILRKNVLIIATRQGLSQPVPDGFSDFALYLGTPDDNRKTVVLPVGEVHSTLILKVAETAKSRAALHCEAKALDAMRETLLANQVPQLLGLVKDGNRLTLTQEFRQRKSISHACMSNAVYGFLAELSKVEGRHISLADWLFENNLLNSNNNSSGGLFDASRKLYSRLEKYSNDGKQILLHRTHGDFAPWNCAWTKQGLFVYDWEESSKQGLALSDAFYYVLSPFVHAYENPDSQKAFRTAIEFATKLHQQHESISEQDCVEEVRMYFALWLMGHINQLPIYFELAERLERDWK